VCSSDLREREMMPPTEEEEAMRRQQNLPTVNAFLGSRSGTAYPQSGGQSREVPAGLMGGQLSGELPWDKFRTYFGREEEETGSDTAAASPMHPLTREEEDERIQRLLD
jgi:hypothetical protein